MSRKHNVKYLQKYYLFFCSTTSLLLLYACSLTKKVPDGEYLLVNNTYKFEKNKIFSDRIPDYVNQKPNKKQGLFLQLSLMFYNASNPKYDTILNEYYTYPNELRNQKLRDSLFIKYKHPEYVGKSLFTNRFFHNLGQPPVILDTAKTYISANSIRKFLVYKGYWDAEASYKLKLDSASKKAKVTYKINQKNPTYIDGYYYDIPDHDIKSIYEESLHKSIVKNKSILDQENLEQEVKRITENMKERGYYKFNASNEEIYFTADTLESRKQVPLTIEIHKDSADSSYKKTTIGNIKVYLIHKLSDTAIAKKDSLLRINFYKINEDYKTTALWRPIIIKNKDIYNQKYLDLSKRNIASTNNFNLINYDETLRKGSDSILDVTYYLAPLQKYEFKAATDLNYSQILNFGISPSIDLTTRNIFGGAENLTTSISGTFGSVQNTSNPDKRNLAYEISAQTSLNFPRLLLPFKTYKLIPKRYSPNTSIVVGASVQDNIGMGRIGFNAGLNYSANVNDVVSHRLSIFNTQLSFTRNKEKYYDYFTGEREVVQQVHNAYFNYSPQTQQDYNNGLLNFDDVSALALNDATFIQSFATSQSNVDLYYSFLQSLLNKDRQTQDVLISSLIYNFIYNEIGKKDVKNPFYFSGKVEFAGNIFSLFNQKSKEDGITTGTSKTIFGIPYSQFIKFDFDIRKYFTFFGGKHTLALRQFVGIGIPYGNSSIMPYVRSYMNGGSNDIRAWRVFGGLGPSDSQLDQKVRAYIMDNIKLTTNIEYRIPLTDMFEGAAFIDAGNIWNTKDSGFDDQFKFNKFLTQMGVGSGIGLRIKIAYVTLRLDAAYKTYNPNQPEGERWVIRNWKPLQPVVNFAFNYPF